MSYLKEYGKSFLYFFCGLSSWMMFASLMSGNPGAFLIFYAAAFLGMAGPLRKWIDEKDKNV